MTDVDRAATPEHRHGTALTLTCDQCGTSWRYNDDAPTQCPECLDHLGELIDRAHPDWCQRDHGCVSPAGHADECDLTGPLCFCPTCERKEISGV